MDVWSFNFRHLRALAATVRLGSLNAAAREVSISQPAMSQAIRKLEQLVGARLFDRSPDGMHSTTQAKVFAKRIDAAMAHIGGQWMTSAQARALLAVARRGSYLGAHHDTGLSQPALHRAVADLGKGVGKPLVERRGKGVGLTKTGRALARALRLARLELEAGLSELDALAGKDVGRISIGAMPLSRARVLPGALAEFHMEHPSLEVSVTEGSHKELIELLRDGEIDLMVGALREPSPGPDVVQEELFVDRPIVLGRVNHPLATNAAGTVTAKDLAQYDWVVASQGAPLNELWSKMFLEAGLQPPPIRMRSGSVMLTRQLLIQTDCLTLLSPDQVSVELEAGWLKKIAETPDWLARTIGITTRADWNPTVSQAYMLKQLKVAAGESDRHSVSKSRQHSL